MNIMSFGATTGEHDWIPDRAIGPTEDALYELEKDYNDRQLSAILNKPFRRNSNDENRRKTGSAHEASEKKN